MVQVTGERFLSGFAELAYDFFPMANHTNTSNSGPGHEIKKRAMPSLLAIRHWHSGKLHKSIRMTLLQESLRKKSRPPSGKFAVSKIGKI